MHLALELLLYSGLAFLLQVLMKQSLLHQTRYYPLAFLQGLDHIHLHLVARKSELYDPPGLYQV